MILMYIPLILSQNDKTLIYSVYFGEDLLTAYSQDIILKNILPKDSILFTDEKTIDLLKKTSLDASSYNDLELSTNPEIKTLLSKYSGRIDMIPYSEAFEAVGITVKDIDDSLDRIYDNHYENFQPILVFISSIESGADYDSSVLNEIIPFTYAPLIPHDGELLYDKFLYIRLGIKIEEQTQQGETSRSSNNVIDMRITLTTNAEITANVLLSLNKASELLNNIDHDLDIFPSTDIMEFLPKSKMSYETVSAFKKVWDDVFSLSSFTTEDNRPVSMFEILKSSNKDTIYIFIHNGVSKSHTGDYIRNILFDEDGLIENIMRRNYLILYERKYNTKYYYIRAYGVARIELRNYLQQIFRDIVLKNKIKDTFLYTAMDLTKSVGENVLKLLPGLEIENKNIEEVKLQVTTAFEVIDVFKEIIKPSGFNNEIYDVLFSSVDDLKSYNVEEKLRDIYIDLQKYKVKYQIHYTVEEFTSDDTINVVDDVKEMDSIVTRNIIEVDYNLYRNDHLSDSDSDVEPVSKKQKFETC
jgi:hypothetical protein